MIVGDDLLSGRARQAVLELLIDLAWALDTGDGERFARAFHLDGDFVLEVGDARHRIEGRDALVADFRSRAEQSGGGTQHRFSNQVLLAESDEACTVWSYWATSSVSAATGQTALTASGWMCDRLTRHGAVWSIRHHHLGLWRDGLAHPRTRARCCN